MEIGELRGWITVITLLTFLGICWWAYRSGNRERFEQDALLPFLDDPNALEGESAAQKPECVAREGSVSGARSHGHE